MKFQIWETYVQALSGLTLSLSYPLFKLFPCLVIKLDMEYLISYLLDQVWQLTAACVLTVARSIGLDCLIMFALQFIYPDLISMALLDLVS